jgi:hypothetical protein
MDGHWVDVGALEFFAVVRLSEVRSAGRPHFREEPSNGCPSVASADSRNGQHNSNSFCFASPYTFGAELGNL